MPKKYNENDLNRAKETRREKIKIAQQLKKERDEIDLARYSDLDFGESEEDREQRELEETDED